MTTKYSQPTKAPTAKVKAAGIGGLLAGVPIGAYLSDITVGLWTLNSPESYQAVADVVNIGGAISGLFTAAITVAFAYGKKSSV